jgi:hypothetical protein
MIRKMTVPKIIRVRGIDAAGMIRYSRIYQQMPAAEKFADALRTHNYRVRIEMSHDVEFELVTGSDV